MCMYTYIHTYIHMETHTHMYICMYVCMYVYVCVCVYIYIYIHVCVFVHTHMVLSLVHVCAVSFTLLTLSLSLCLSALCVHSTPLDCLTSSPLLAGQLALSFPLWANLVLPPLVLSSFVPDFDGSLGVVGDWRLVDFRPGLRSLSPLSVSHRVCESPILSMSVIWCPLPNKDW